MKRLWFTFEHEEIDYRRDIGLQKISQLVYIQIVEITFKAVASSAFNRV